MSNYTKKFVGSNKFPANANQIFVEGKTEGDEIVKIDTSFEQVVVNQTAAIAIELPDASKLQGNRLVVIDISGDASTNNITISTEGTSKINGADTVVIDSDYGSIEFTSISGNYYAKASSSVPILPTTLNALSDVNITTPTNGQLLEFDSNSGKWVNATVS